MPTNRLAAITLLAAQASRAIADPLAALNDEFDAPTLPEFQRVIDVESWPNNPLEVLDINVSRPGWMTMIPHTTVWYEDYRGPLVFKEVSGDFVVETSVEVSNRAATGAPGRSYSLAGIMVRAPRAITPATWTAGEERYTFLSIGSADQPGTFQYEVKSTSNYDELPNYSQLDISPVDCGCGQSIIQTARIGEYVIQIAKTPTGPWRVVNRYRRPDLPATVQAGFVAYTDWENAQLYPVAIHNTATITTTFADPLIASQPDLRAHFDYIRFTSPGVPANLAGRDLANRGIVSDDELLAFLGGSLAASDTPSDVWLMF